MTFDNSDNDVINVPFCKNFSFASGTTYGCGGIADCAFFPRTEEEACSAFSFALKSGKPFCVLGCGSDVLAQDGFYDGYVICTSALNQIKYATDCGDISVESKTSENYLEKTALKKNNIFGAADKKADKNKCSLKDDSDFSLKDYAENDTAILEVGAGVKVKDLLIFCKKNGLSGTEYIAGIPASLGGLAFMNGGAAGKYISENIVSVRIFDGEIKTFSKEECNFTYKHSTMRDIKCVILSIKLAFKRENPLKVAQNIKNRLAERKSLPSGRSCGCVFENYCGVSAGKIIESADLKGVRIGGAYVSEKHANFIINDGTNSADVYALIRYVKDEVYKKFGITLKEEVCYIGEFK